MATTVTVPATTLSVGAHSFGPVSVTGLSTVTISIDRTVGLNAAPATTVLAFEADYSSDGGTTWSGSTTAQTIGGTYTDKSGVENVSSFQVQLPAGTNALKATLTVSGAPVKVGGTVTAA